MIEMARIRIIEIVSHRVGRAAAISRREVTEILKHGDRPIDISDRPLRRAYEDLPFCHCNEGMFKPASTQEVEEYGSYLFPKVGPIIAAKKKRLIYAHYPELIPRGQIELGL